MNTTDIRDLESNSSLFWITAIPFTMAVVGLALIYGYKWDDIVGSVSRMWARRHAVVQSRRDPRPLRDALPSHHLDPIGGTFETRRALPWLKGDSRWRPINRWNKQSISSGGSLLSNLRG
ncbi:hypothetical protein F5Y15DRAFT_221315 [Xylariaceae sp. FL0016]|nr:hypothetical protein F5Y15DRAFT_221315 [Xylariaceae sp. FL0016]